MVVEPDSGRMHVLVIIAYNDLLVRYSHVPLELSVANIEHLL